MIRRWSFTLVATVVLSIGLWRLLSPPPAKITLLPVAHQFDPFPQPPKTGSFVEPPPLVVAIYDVGDILDAAKERGIDRESGQVELRRILTSYGSAWESWPEFDGSRTRCEPIGDRIIIVQTQEAQQQINDLLQAIRRADSLKWAWKAR